MANLTLEGREEVRAYVEEKLKEVPEGKRMKLPKETLEQLLFEEVVVNEEEKVNIKLPVWSGKFLRKLDLSEVDFEDVTWCKLAEKTSYFECVEINNPDYEKDMKKIYNIKRLSNNYIVDYSGTNASIDLSKSFDFKYEEYLTLVDCDLSNCKNIYIIYSFVNANDQHAIYFENCNFSNSNLKIPNIFPILSIINVNFENCDLSNWIIDLNLLIKRNEDRSIFDLSKINLKNTGAKIIYDPNYRNHDVEPISLKVLEELKKDSLVGCYVNGEFILSPEEIAIKKQEKQELQRLKEEIASLFREQQEEDTTKHV